MIGDIPPVRSVRLMYGIFIVDSLHCLTNNCRRSYKFFFNNFSIRWR
jgi:hypothetical protein